MEIAQTARTQHFHHGALADALHFALHVHLDVGFGILIRFFPASFNFIIKNH